MIYPASDKMPSRRVIVLLHAWLKAHEVSLIMSAQNQLPNLDKIFRDDDEPDFVPSGGYVYYVFIYTHTYIIYIIGYD